jgi:DNA modification methylase
MGFGYWTRKQVEPCWLFTRGNPKRLSKGVRQAIIEPRREHSRKPDAQYERIEQLVDGPISSSSRAQSPAGLDRVGQPDGQVRGQIGLETTPEEYVARLVAVFHEVRRVLRDDGTLWLNIGDSYAGSGRGGYPGGKGSLQGSTTGQDNSRVARGSQKAAGMHEVQRQSGAIARAWVPPPSGLKQKDMIGIPWMLAFALRADGWYLRQEIIWAKPNPMPESVQDRCTKAHESIFLLSKSPRYFYDADAIAEGFQTDPAEHYEVRATITGRGTQGAAAARGNDRAKSGGFPPRVRGVPPRHAQYPETSDQSGLDQVGRGGRRNKRSVWTVATAPFPEAHFATYPPELIEPCILAGCPNGGTVLDPFFGAGTTGLVTERLQRDCIGIEISPKFVKMARRRIRADLGRVQCDQPEAVNAHGPLFDQTMEAAE